VSAPRIRVLLVEDHQVVREGLRALLRAESDIEVVGEAADGAAVDAPCISRHGARRTQRTRSRASSLGWPWVSRPSRKSTVRAQSHSVYRHS